MNATKFKTADEGLRVNWRNVSYVTIIEETKDYAIVKFYWRYKAAIQSKEIRVLIGSGQNIVSILISYGLTKIKDLYINLNRLLFIEDTLTERDTYKITFTFDSGITLRDEIDFEVWKSWRVLHLR